MTVSAFEPAYVATLDSGELERRIERARRELASCRLCPRDCRVDRLSGEIGACRCGRWAQVASSFAHFGEEACLRGSRGSGTIFFSGCNLRCVFCQNFDISWQGQGSPVQAAWIAGRMLDLQQQGCHNINLVTPEHVVPQALEAIWLAARQGLRLPIVYNTSAYDSRLSLELLDGVVDIYMPDFKFWSPQLARRYLLAEDYPATARAAILEMHRQVGDLVFDAQGVAQRGLLVRHLVMPAAVDDTRRIMRFLARQISPDTFVNLMAQYRPAGLVLARPGRFPDLERRVRRPELDEAWRAAREAGLHRFDQPRGYLWN